MRFVGGSGMRKSLLVILASSAVIAVLSAGMPAAASIRPPMTESPPPQGEGGERGGENIPEGGIPDEKREELLGEDYSQGEDIAYTTLGGLDGVAILRAVASDGYQWEQIALLPARTLETDNWVANSCIDASAKHMAVVYAPRAFTNDESNFLEGAWGAIINLEDGSIIDLGRGYSLAYFNPGCGAGSFAAFARYTTEQLSQLASVDLSTGEPVFKVDVEGQVTSPVTTEDGGVLGVTARGIHRIGPDGVGEMVASSSGLAFELRVDSTERLAFLEMETTEKTAARVLDLKADKKKPQTVARGGLTELGLDRAGGAIYVLGASDETHPEADRVHYLRGSNVSGAVSSRGRMVVGSVASMGMGDPTTDDDEDSRPHVDTWIPGTNKHLRFELATYADDLVASRGEITNAPIEEPYTEPAALNVRPIGEVVSTVDVRAGSSSDPIEGSTERYCAVPRNDPHSQAFQPKPRQVQWAVDRAVSGQLTEPRANNWRNLGMPAYTPQGLFPRVSLTGGGTIPPQIVLGVLAQESNLWQASRYTSPGSTGNPLIGDFYGSRPTGDEPDSAIWNINFPDADCGYGVGQITDGMRLAGREKAGETALPFNSQRAIALDYTANVAMAVRMLGQKWNEVKAAGMDINNGDPTYIENWFFAVWTYNTGFYPNTGGPWGVGWLNNPINPIYPANRTPFLSATPADAAHPQDWPYPEKVIGFAAYSLELAQTATADPSSRTYPTNYVSGFTTAWWPGQDDLDADLNRRTAKPPIALFCSMSVNSCSPTASFPCTLSGEPKCWWHADAVWKTDCAAKCGQGEERFDASYPREVDAIRSTLPEVTKQYSFPPNCEAPPSGVLVVDNVSHLPVRDGCSRRSTQGSFQFEFFSPGANGSYSSKVDLHQQGGGFNAHFYWTHMRKSPDSVDNINDRLKIVGRWSLGQSLNQWTRVWVHLPDHAAWSEQAAYKIELGNGQTRTRYLPQRRYANTWVPIGVFQMNGVPAVSLSNMVTKNDGVNEDDIAWDAVGFQPLSAKPADFVVGLGDSFSSGEGAGDYAAWSDHDGDDSDTRNACHQSKDAWIRKLSLPSSGSPTIGSRESSIASSLDFHFLACSAAETKHLLPSNQSGSGQYGLVSQLDAGYLDENTTLVTLSVGGNDLRFGDIVLGCVNVGYCGDNVLANDSQGMYAATMSRLDTVLPNRLANVLSTIKLKAPNAKIVLVGYPRLFDAGTACMLISTQNQGWLNTVSNKLAQVMAAAATAANEPSHRVIFADPQHAFQGRTLCTVNSGFNAIQPIVTPGDLPWGIWPGQTLASAESGHPNDAGTVLYSVAVQAALSGVYP